MKKEALKKSLEKVFNIDGWVNVLSGLGKLNKDKRVSAKIDFSPMTETDAEVLYAGDDMAAKIIDQLPQDALREGFELENVDDALEKPLFKEFDRLRMVPAVVEAWKWARLYGGSAIFMACDDALDLKEPMKPGAKITSLVVFSRWELKSNWTSIRRSLKDPGYGEAVLYDFYPRGYGEDIGAQIHASRVIRFDGAQLPRRLHQQNDYWGDSILNRLVNAIRNYNTVHDSAASVMQDFRQAVFKIKDLANRIAEGDDQTVIKRLGLLDVSRSIARAVVIDADGEDFEYRTGSVAGMPELIGKAENRLVAGTNTPHTILLGESPTGSNATGNSTTLAWYDNVAAEQNTYLKPRLMPLIAKIALGLGQKLPEDWGVEFNSLWQMDEKEQAEVHKTQAEADQINVDIGALDPSEVRESRFGGKRYSLQTKIDASLDKKLAAPKPEPKAPAQVTPPAPKADADRLDFIEHRGSKWVVLSHEGKVLGEHATEEEAQQQLGAIEAAKHAKK